MLSNQSKKKLIKVFFLSFEEVKRPRPIHIFFFTKVRHNFFFLINKVIQSRFKNLKLDEQLLC